MTWSGLLGINCSCNCGLNFAKMSVFGNRVKYMLNLTSDHIGQVSWELCVAAIVAKDFAEGPFLASGFSLCRASKGKILVGLLGLKISPKCPLFSCRV